MAEGELLYRCRDRDGRLAVPHRLDGEAVDLIGRNKYAANNKGGPHKASKP
jgi:hypothetical protein